MDPEFLKKEWSKVKLSRWVEFSKEELDKSPLKEATKSFLNIGFPEDAAPFLGFGWRSYDWKFYNIYDFYAAQNIELDIITKDYWIFGGDGGGNPICFDVSNNDELVLLDHEADFEIIDTINRSLAELAGCIFAYENFIETVNSEIDEDAFYEERYTKQQVENLKQEFLSINPNIFKESNFWEVAIEMLTNDAK